MTRQIDFKEQHNSFSRTLLSQAGQSMVEFLVILPTMLLLIFGTIQFALIYHAKITLNYAAFEAARAGSLNCDKKYKDYNNKCTSEVGQFDAVKEGFARGLAPLYSYFEPDKTKRAAMTDPASGLIDAYQQGRAKIFAEFDTESEKKNFIRIERLNPTDKAFSDFAPDQVIPNNNLMYRSSGKGSSSKIPIQDANLLHLRITYWYPLYVPLVNRLMFNKFICCKGIEDSFFFGWQSESVSSCKWASHPVCQGNDPRIPLTATAVMRMQAPLENSSEYYTSE